MTVKEEAVGTFYLLNSTEFLPKKFSLKKKIKLIDCKYLNKENM